MQTIGVAGAVPFSVVLSLSLLICAVLGEID